MKKVIYPGTFDPFTNGHLDIACRAAKLFDEVIIAVMNNKNKNSLFNLEKRAIIVRECTKKLKNVKVVTFDGMVYTLANKLNSNIIIRGLRDVNDYSAEKQIENYNIDLSGETLETIYFNSRRNVAYISSSGVRELIKYKKDISKYVPEEAYKYINNCYKEENYGK